MSFPYLVLATSAARILCSPYLKRDFLFLVSLENLCFPYGLFQNKIWKTKINGGHLKWVSPIRRARGAQFQKRTPPNEKRNASRRNNCDVNRFLWCQVFLFRFRVLFLSFPRAPKSWKSAVSLICCGPILLRFSICVRARPLGRRISDQKRKNSFPYCCFLENPLFRLCFATPNLGETKTNRGNLKWVSPIWCWLQARRVFYVPLI